MIALVLNNYNPIKTRVFKGAIVFFIALLFWLSLAIPVMASAPTETNVNLQVSASWGGGDILNLNIADLETGERQQVAIRLSEFVTEGENVPYILIQAMDLLGERQSGVIQIENPLYIPALEQGIQNIGNSGSSIAVNELPDNVQNIIAEVNEPQPLQTLTPDGTGTVVDNIMTVNEIEFFTVSTDNGSDFFLVVDRQRTSNNVYLLNTVTEADLMALAQARGENLPLSAPNVASVQPPVEQPSAPTMDEILQAIQDSNEQNQVPQPQQSGNNGLLLLMGFVAAIMGVGFLCLKFLLPYIKNIGQGKEEDIEPEEFEEFVYDEEDYHQEIDYENVEASDDDTQEEHEIAPKEAAKTRGDDDDEE